MKKVILTLILLSLVFVVGVAGCGEATEKTVISTGEVKEFDITARNWEFVPDTITVNAGDTVKLTVTSEDVNHGFSLFEFGVNENLEPGKTVEIEFIADKKGEFNFFCSIPCGSGHGGMNGKLIVE